MNRFGIAFLLLVVLAGIGFVSMLRPGDGGGRTAPVAETPEAASAGRLAIPVAGVRPAQIRDSFVEARGGGTREHRAVDIMAPLGTPVTAALPGTVEKIFESGDGGHTVYVRSPDAGWVAYYAHLDRYAPGLAEGQRLAAGAPIGRVGYSGNASPDGPHLHFELKRMRPGDRWWQGEAVDPYPLMVR